ncbi:MAG: hypothetical protein H7841_02985 [Magnetospirillum sp. WYHS-4]
MTRFQMGTALVLASLLMGVVVAAWSVTEDGSAGRFQIVRANDTTAWRLDTWTGEVVPCRLSSAGMVCRTTQTASAKAKSHF